MDVVEIAKSYLLGVSLLLPVAVVVLIGWWIHRFVAARRSPQGGRLARAYCAFIALGAGVLIFAMINVPAGMRGELLALNPASAPASAVLCGVHLIALFRPRTDWLIFALALSAGALVASPLLIALGLRPGPTPGQLLFLAVGGGVLWLTARASLARRGGPAQDAAGEAA